MPVSKVSIYIDALPESDLGLLDSIGVKRGCTRKGSGVEIQKVSALFIMELRAGLLGRISFETPDMTTKEEEDYKIFEAQKAGEKVEHDRVRRLKTMQNRR